MAPSTTDKPARPTAPSDPSAEASELCSAPRCDNEGPASSGVAFQRPGPESSVEPGGTGRFWCAVLAGLLVTAPLAWLLSYGATLPFFIGVFFFALFGIVIGAVVHRVAAPRRPYARWVLVVGTSIIVLGGWSFSVIKEGTDVPAGMAEKAVRRTRDIGDLSARKFRASVDRQIRSFLRTNYPPGGSLGYALWVLKDGVIRKGAIDGLNMSLVAPQRRYWWAIRVVLSLGLLAFGVGSQVWLLRLQKDPPVRAMDAGPDDHQA